MVDTAPIPAPNRSLSGSANLTLRVKFVPGHTRYHGNENLKI